MSAEINAPLITEKSIDFLVENDYVILDSFFDQNALSMFFNYLQNRRVNNVFKAAAIGKGQKQLVSKEIRGDEIYWLEKEKDKLISNLFRQYDQLVEELKNGLRISLSGYELHFAHYPAGTYYKKHLDTFHYDSKRTLSVVLYLNENWTKGNGGEILLHTKNDNISVEPIGGRMVLFNSQTVPHEVLPTNISRYSITGWLLAQSIAF